MDLGQFIFSIIALVSGALFLFFGAEGLVRGSSSVAIRFRVTPLVVGLTIVAFGTSSPEFVVSVSAALRGNSEIALGNVVGSNICNIALILGVAALIRPITINLKVIKNDISLMIIVSALLILLLLDGKLSRIDGVILFSGIIIYNYVTIHMSRKVINKEAEKKYVESIPKMQKKWLDIIFILGGLIILIVGANLFLTGAIKIAKYFGVSDIIIGLTVVALGTSLPELATSVVAAIKDEGDISIGNAIGSNIFNILSILGFAAIIHPIDGKGIQWTDLGVMMLVAIIILPLAWTKLTLSRGEGAFLILIYAGYIYYLSTHFGF